MIAIIALLATLNIVYGVATLAMCCEGIDNALSTYSSVYKYFCDTTTMNKFGCILSTIVVYVIMPITFIPVKVCMGIYWVCHYHKEG